MEEVEICIPALNEEEVIIDTIDELLQLCDKKPEYQWKITVIDNGSTDETAQRVQAHHDSRVCLLQLAKKGKGLALSSAAKKSTSDFLVYIDADLSADPAHILEFLAETKKGADIVAGSRLLDTQNVNRSFWRTCTARFFQFYANVIVPVPIVDSQCGLKLMNRKGIEILASCEEDGWFFDRELLAKAVKRKLAIVEIPVVWEEFKYPNRKSKLNVVRAGVQSLHSLWKIRHVVRKYT